MRDWHYWLAAYATVAAFKAEEAVEGWLRQFVEWQATRR